MAVAPSFAKASAFAQATVDGTAGRPEGRWIGSEHYSDTFEAWSAAFRLLQLPTANWSAPQCRGAVKYAR